MDEILGIQPAKCLQDGTNVYMMGLAEQTSSTPAFPELIDV
jgi:hypothetical protein